MVADLREEGKEWQTHPRSERLTRQTKHDEQRAIELFGGF
jgi:hypothetical protein